MGLLNKIFSKPTLTPLRLPSGSFTLDREGNVLVATLPSDFPSDLVAHIGKSVLETFRGAHSAQLPLSQLVIRYSSLKITAREMRGGAIIFLAPLTPISPTRQP